MKKLFDLRFVIGLFFLSMGIILMVYYFIATVEADMHPVVNKWSGGVYLIFGILMIRLSYRYEDADESE